MRNGFRGQNRNLSEVFLSGFCAQNCSGILPWVISQVLPDYKTRCDQQAAPGGDESLEVLADKGLVRECCAPLPICWREGRQREEAHEVQAFFTAVKKR